MVPVGKYTIHGCHRKDEDSFSSKFLSLKWFGLLESISPKVSKVILSMPAIHLIPLRCIERYVSWNTLPPSTAARWISSSTVVMQQPSTTLWLCFLSEERICPKHRWSDSPLEWFVSLCKADFHPILFGKMGLQRRNFTCRIVVFLSEPRFARSIRPSSSSFTGGNMGLGGRLPLTHGTFGAPRWKFSRLPSDCNQLSHKSEAFAKESGSWHGSLVKATNIPRLQIWLQCQGHARLIFFH